MYSKRTIVVFLALLICLTNASIPPPIRLAAHNAGCLWLQPLRVFRNALCVPVFRKNIKIEIKKKKIKERDF